MILILDVASHSVAQSAKRKRTASNMEDYTLTVGFVAFQMQVSLCLHDLFAISVTEPESKYYLYAILDAYLHQLAGHEKMFFFLRPGKLHTSIFLQECYGSLLHFQTDKICFTAHSLP